MRNMQLQRVWLVLLASCLALLQMVYVHTNRADEPKPAAAEESLPLLTVATTRFGSLDLMTLDVAGKNAVQITKDPAGAVQPT